MRTITVFSSHAGTGCRTSAMALGSAWLAQGRRLVLVDATEQGTANSTYNNSSFLTPLEQWANRVARPHPGHADKPKRGVGGHELVTHRASHSGNMADDLAWFAAQGFELALIVGASTLNVSAQAALAHADLVVAPFTDRDAALSASQTLRRYLPKGTPALGLATGLRGSTADQQAARTAFKAAPLARAELPWLDAFAVQVEEGCLPEMVFTRQVWVPRRQIARWEPVSGFAAHEAIRRAWVAATTVASEAWWLAHGYDLVPRGHLAGDEPAALDPAALPSSASGLPSPVPPGLPATPAKVMDTQKPRNPSKADKPKPAEPGPGG